jgi:outer membrane protein assembly factor BamB
LVIGDRIFVVTGNGNNDEGKVVSPKAPSFVALEKATGKLLWQSNLPGSKIIQGQWSNPVYAEANTKPQIIFPGGDGWLYALQPDSGDLIWKFNCSPAKQPDETGIQPYIIATPVVHENCCYLAVGAYPNLDDLPKAGHFFCIDITKSGDVSCKNDNFDPKDPANKGSALVWYFGGLIKPPPTKGRKVHFGYSISTAAVNDGLAYIAEGRGYMHCLDAKTGEPQWVHDFKTDVLGSPYWVDGRIYICASDGECHVFEHGRKYQRPRSIDMQESLESTPVVANGVLYINTSTKVYAIGAK